MFLLFKRKVMIRQTHVHPATPNTKKLLRAHTFKRRKKKLTRPIKLLKNLFNDLRQSTQ